MTDNELSIVAGGRKLLYNVDRLLDARNGHPRPVMFHVCLTNRCQLKCDFCCYGDRQPKDELTLDALRQFAYNSIRLGTRAWELTGGGEPLLHPHVNDLIAFLSGLEINVGLMTNGLALDRLDNPATLRWIRVSLHALQQNRGDELAGKIALVKDRVKTTCCFVATEANVHLLPTVLNFAVDIGVKIKVEPNCYQPQEAVLRLVERLRREIVGAPNVFLDFNTVFDRRCKRCYVHLIKPFLYTDGWLCVCPLPVSRDRNVDPQFRLCRMEEVTDYYQGLTTLVRYHDCAFCRYGEHNAVAEGVLNPLDDKEFC